MFAEEFGEVVAAHFAAFFVIGGDEGGIIFGVDIGIDDDDGDFLGGGFVDDAGERGEIIGGQDNAGDIGGLEEVIDDFDLRGAVALFERSFPDDVEVFAILGGFIIGALCAGVDGFPVNVGGALGDDGDLLGTGSFGGRGASILCGFGVVFAAT